MTKQTIISASIYNNAAAKLNINLSDGKTMCANVLDHDKKKFINKEVTANELVAKYFTFDGKNYSYSNPNN